MKEMVGGCCVCSDERGWPENPLVYCDGQGCTVAVHQACYGIVTVPTGPWYCRKCESQERSARVRCELCPSRDGALKRTDNGGWAHVVCALYIPEVRFGNVTTMEPIILQLIPSERFNKVCYICEELGKGSRAGIGACMQCNKAGCKQQFHVTCAQALGLLCEEAGNYLDNVKYCGYCQHHYSKLKKSGNVKPIPPYKPISSDNHSSDSSPEKDSEIISGTVKSSGVQSTTTSSSTSGKRKSGSSNSKTTAASKSSASSGGSKSSISNSQNHQKGIHPSGNTPKLTVTAEKLPVSKTSQSAGANIKGSNTASKQNPVDTIEHSSVVITNIADHDKVIADKSNGRSTPSVKDPKLSGYLDTVITASDSAFGTDKSDSNLSSASSLAPKETKGGNKKRKVGGSRTPTPNSNISQSEADKGLSVNISSVVVPVSTQQASIIGSTNTIGGTLQQSGNISAVHYDSLVTGESGDKIKKMKTDHTASNVSSIPTVVPNSSSPSVTSTEPNLSLQSSSVTTNVIQPPTNSPIGSQNSLLVSVPLTNASLATAGNGVTNSLTNQTSVVTNTTSLYQQVTQQDRVVTSAMNIGNPSVSLEPLNHSLYVSSGVTTSDLNTGGLKISYEKQPGASGLTSANNMTRISDPSVSVNEQEVTGKRGRSQSIDKPEKGGRGKKRGSTGSTSNSAAAPQPPNQIPVANKRSSRSQHPTPPPVQGAFSSINQNPQQTVIKESPPSSPGSETTSVVSTSRKTKGRKSGGNIPNNSNTNSQDSKDIKVFQNGINAPHMLGNQLNPNSHMAQKMSDHLNSELEAHSIYTPDALPANSLVGPQLHSRVIASARSTSSNGSASNSTLGNTTNATPQTLDQLLERQWEQGSQFLMEQAQHFDIASLLSCLHQLRAENLRLEEHVNSLLQRRDHLLAVNARLAIPLTTQSQPVPATSQPHTVNNIHPAVSTQHVEMSSRSGGFPLQNGLPPEPLPSQQQQSQGFTPQQIQLRTTQPHSQPSPTIRHSQSSNTNYVPGVTSTSSQQQSSQQHGVVRANRSSSVPDTTRGNAPPHSTYGQYQSQGSVVTTQHQQMVIRRDSDLHHQMAMPGSSKPS